MNTMTTFYTIGNINLKTVKLVALSIRDTFGPNAFDQMIILNSVESEEEQDKQIKIYREYIKTNFTVLQILTNDDGKIKLENLIKMFSEEGDKIVDLSNGRKVTSSMLYTAASLCNVDDIYYLLMINQPQNDSLNMKIDVDYRYIKIGKFQGLKSLAKVSCFDLIYYNDEVLELFSENHSDVSAYEVAKSGLITGISDFFSKNDGRSAINNITIGNERLINLFLDYIKNDSYSKKFAKENGVVFDNKKDPIGMLQYFFKQLTREDMTRQAISPEKKELFMLRTLPSLLSTMREYRNLSSHSSMNPYKFTTDEIRMALNIMIEAYKCAKKNSALWDKLKE